MMRSRGFRCLIRGAVRVALVATTALASADMHRACADTIEGALALAYQNNPQINSQRAATRATDEGVGVALSGYRPQVSATASLGEQYLDTLSKPTGGGKPESAGTIATAAYGLTTKQTLFNGFQTASRT